MTANKFLMTKLSSNGCHARSVKWVSKTSWGFFPFLFQCFARGNGMSPPSPSLCHGKFKTLAGGSDEGEV